MTRLPAPLHRPYRTARRTYTPQSVGDLALWYPIDGRAWQDSSRTTPAGAGEPVGARDDYSGNARHLYQATTLKKPTFSATGPGIQYDGVDDLMATTYALNPASMFAAMLALWGKDGSDAFKTIALQPLKAALVGEYGIQLEDGDIYSVALPANWNANSWEIGIWYVPDFGMDGQTRNILVLRLDSTNYIQIAKSSSDLLFFDVHVAGVTKSTTLAPTFAAGVPMFIGIRLSGGTATVYADVAGDGGAADTGSIASIASFSTSSGWTADFGHFNSVNFGPGATNALVTVGGGAAAITDRYALGAGQPLATWLDTYRAAVVVGAGGDASSPRLWSYQGALNILGAPAATGRLNFDAASSHDVSFGNVTQVDAATKFWVLVEAERDRSGVLEIVASRWGSSNNQRQWHLYLNSADRIGFEIGDGSGGSWFGTSPGGVIPGGTRGMILVRIDLTQATDAARMKIDLALYNGSTRKYGAWASQSISFTGTAPAAFITAGSATNMYLARDVGSYFDGKIGLLRWATGTTVTDAERDLITVNEPNPFLTSHAYSFEGDANDFIGTSHGTVTGAGYVDDGRSDPGRFEKYVRQGQYAFRASGQRIDHGDYAAMDGATKFELDIIVTPRWKGTEHVYVERGRLGTDGQLTVVQNTTDRLIVYVPTSNTDAGTYAQCNAFFSDYVATRVRVTFDGTLSGNANRLKVEKSTRDRTTGQWSTLAAVTVDVFSGTIPSALRSPSGSPHLMVGDVSGGSTSWASCLFDRLLVHAGTIATAASPYADVPGARDIWCDYNGSATNAGNTGATNHGTVIGSAPQWYDGRQPLNLDLTSGYEIDRATDSAKGTYSLRVLRPATGGSYLGLKNATLTAGALGWIGATIKETAGGATDSMALRLGSPTAPPVLNPSGATFVRYTDAAHLTQSGALDVRATNAGSGDQLYIDELDAVQFAVLSPSTAAKGLSTRVIASASKAAASGPYLFVAITGAEKIRIGYRNDAGVSANAESSGAITIAPHSLSLEFDGTTLRAYIDAVLVVSLVVSGTFTGLDTLTLGGLKTLTEGHGFDERIGTAWLHPGRTYSAIERKRLHNEYLVPLTTGLAAA